MTPNPISDAFEGENSSLRKTYDEAVDVPEWVEEKVQAVKAQSPSTASDVEWCGDGHFCRHHPDDPAHGDSCYSFLEYIGFFTQLHTTLLSVASEAEARGMKEERERVREWAESHRLTGLLDGSSFNNYASKAYNNALEHLLEFLSDTTK